ncbi:hypothetical protein A9Q84_13880 [Halobacteriovorax marinus]|uniref:Uncharacterized protein n=1 Tax=Halobacteriovorax marinus TaxID=97084 RepID=A0A1Y5FEU0_9BACT|nr:hypothetical protein A9Q84_13880 [Halobacteriovorax marinus]
MSLLLTSTSYAKQTKSRGNSFNPDIGINILFLNQESSRDKAEDGMKFQEAELQFSSDVDTYFSAKALFAIAEEGGEFGIEPEEAYVETISLPHVIVKIGKSKMPIGKHNELHAHAFPFINAPLINETILGDEGLNEIGVGVSGLIPLPWFSELTFNYTQGDHADLFNGGSKDNKAIITRFKNLWDLSSSTTLELGFSGAKGKNSDQQDTSLYGADLTLKWRPSKSSSNRSFEWTAEFLEKDRKGAADGKLSGIVTHFKYQLAKRWYGQYRHDYLGLNDSKSIASSKRHTGLIAFLPSEFSSVRLQYETIDDGQVKDEKRLSLQLNISIGAHPAHTY